MKTKHVSSNEHQTKSLFLSLPLQMGIVLAMVGIVVYTAFFSTYPPVHDFFHDFRHSLLIIPCH
jgi:cobalt transporter subunit CbtB